MWLLFYFFLLENWLAVRLYCNSYMLCVMHNQNRTRCHVIWYCYSFVYVWLSYCFYCELLLYACCFRNYIADVLVNCSKMNPVWFPWSKWSYCYYMLSLCRSAMLCGLNSVWFSWSKKVQVHIIYICLSYKNAG